MREQGFKGPALAAKEVLTYFPTKRDIKILDCGAGTGCVGEEVNKTELIDPWVIITRIYICNFQAKFSYHGWGI